MPFIADSFNEQLEQDKGCDNIDTLQRLTEVAPSNALVPVTTNFYDWEIGPVTYLFNAFNDSVPEDDFVDDDIMESISREVDLMFLEIVSRERGYTQGFEDAVRMCQQDRFQTLIDELMAFDTGYQEGLKACATESEYKI